MAEQNASEAEQVEQACTEFSGALKEALAWTGEACNAERIQPDKRAIEEDLRRVAFLARKLAQTASRPMCVGVFGPSQSGKSYLVSVLARKGPRLMALFDDPQHQIDFIADINPAGGKEATGLVTRFTIHPVKTPPGYPVALRLLNQTDLVKIIINAYVNDGDIDREQPLTRENLVAHLDTFAKAANAGYADELREEDVWDLQDYVQRHFRRINVPLVAFWDRFAYLAPRVPLASRAALYSIIWGRHEPLTMLYNKLVDGLARLGFADEAFAQLESLLPSAHSILNIDTLKRISDEDASTLRITTAKGATAELPRSVVAALTAELRIVIAESPRDYFDHTDLLDFPGYRSRGGEDLQKAFATAPADTLFNMLRRGKVDYLFQRYTVDQELTSLLLCLRDSNLEVKTLPGVLEEWIDATHGATAEDRAGRPVLLFFCLTFFDNHFVSKPSDDPDNLGERFAARMQASLVEPFGSKPGTWPSNWAPGKSFDNCYWIRNPTITPQAMIEYGDGNREVGFNKQKAAEIEKLRAAHAELPAVRQHFRDPARAFNEVMKLNDGGVTYLADNLAKVCLPQMKTIQVRARLGDLRKRMTDRLARYYITTDIDKRLHEREEVCGQILSAVEECLERERFGTFLATLCIDRVDLGYALYVARTTGVEPEPLAGGGIGPKSGRIGSITGILINRDRKPAFLLHNRPTGNINLGNAAVQTWASHMRKMSESEPFARAIGIPTVLLREIVAEIMGAARRRKLNEEIATRLDLVLHIESTDAVVAKATLVASRLLNNFICTLGYDRQPPERRPKVPLGENTERPVFYAPLVVHDASGIGEDRAPFAFNYPLDWCTAFQATLRENASSEDGSMQDPVQNARLGKILESLHGQ